MLRARIQGVSWRIAVTGRAAWPETLREKVRVVNHKRVLRLMREDNLLSLRRKKHVFTTDSAHTLPIYPNLTRHTTLNREINQLWVADITYIRLRNEFIYLAVVLDAYSRQCHRLGTGHARSRGTGSSSFADGAERASLESGLIHHSDRGIQYASRMSTPNCWTRARFGLV